MIKVERVYDTTKSQGFRILVDRLWPRGVSKEKSKIDLWLKEIGPSDELRKWFGHDPAKWHEFKKKFFQELDKNAELVDQIIKKSKTDDVILLYGAKDKLHNNAIALKEYIGARKITDK